MPVDKSPEDHNKHSYFKPIQLTPGQSRKG